MDSKESKDSPPESHKESSGESNKISGAEPEVEESMEQPISVSPDKELPNSESLKPEEPIAAKKKSIIVESPKIKTKVVRQTPEIPFRPSYPVAEPTPLPPPVDLSLEPPAPIFIPPVPTASASELSPATRDTFRIIESGIAAKGKPKGQMTINISKDDFETGLGTVDPEKNREGIGIKVKNDSAGSASERQVLGEAFSALMSAQYEASIALYKQALAINNKNQDALLGLATAYQKSRMLPQARAVYNQLLTLYPNNQKAINNFVVLASEESPTEALNELLRLEKTNPGYSPVVAQIGMIYDRMNQPQQAIQYLRRALSISPQNMAYRYNLAVLLDKNGDYQNAIQLYKQLIDASARGVQIPAAARQLQERLTFLRSK
jgi:Tfp pilus assembly protein PilF